MSKYTSIILYFSSVENRKERIEEINNFESNNRKIHFEDVNDTTKYPDIFPRLIYVGSFNYFPLDDFLLHLQHKVKWNSPQYVQLLVAEEDRENCSFYIEAGAKLLYQGEHL